LAALIKNREVEKRGPLTDAEVLQAIVASCKQRQEAIEQYERGDGRIWSRRRRRNS
jgi:hypothetical protein